MSYDICQPSFSKLQVVISGSRVAGPKSRSRFNVAAGENDLGFEVTAE